MAIAGDFEQSIAFAFSRPDIRNYNGAMEHFFHFLRRIACILTLLVLCTCCFGLDEIQYRKDGRQGIVQGRVLATHESGMILVESQDGFYWPLAPNEIGGRNETEVLFEHFGRQRQAEKVLKELPEGFSEFSTRHYLIVHNASSAYARWCGSLLERLYAAFTNYWNRRGLDLSSPEYPLVVLLFSNRAAYEHYAAADGIPVQNVAAYYNFETNRVAMYDLTGIESAGGVQGRGRSSEAINRILSQPRVERAVATAVHEATHQIAFNCGLTRRFSDVPLWVSEGMAVYFESPDLNSSTGWRTIGNINRERLARFRAYQQRRPADSLITLISDDERLRDPRRALDAYAESWALTYFLMRRQTREYRDYLKALSEKPFLSKDDAKTRIRDFEAAFGDIDVLDQVFLKYARTLR